MRRKNARYIVYICIVVVLSIFLVLQYYSYSRAADSSVTVNTSELTTNNPVRKEKNKTVFFLKGKRNALYQSRDTNIGAAYDILKKSINVKDVAQVNAGINVNDLAITRTLDDNQDPILKKINKSANRKHFHFQQKVDSLSVYGSSVAVHVQNDHDVYAVTGNVLQNPSLQPSRYTLDQAVNIVNENAKRKYKSSAVITQKNEVAFNPEFTGISADQNTYPAAVITTASATNSIIPPTRYIISLTTGEILQELDLAETVLTRQINDCNGATGNNCNVARREGDLPTGNTEVDGAYNFAADVYNFYLNTYQRDSYDNNGGAVNVFVNLPSVINGQQFCPNALWVHHTATSGNQLQVCPGLAVQDIIAHEYTHGVVEYTADLDLMNQTGAANEGIADTFATGVDGNWTMGENSSVGVIRHIDDPTKNTVIGGTALSPMPDKLFSQYYYCGTQDRGGVHRNMSIPTKAHYLMSVGGTFNGCTISPIGMEKSLKIWYQALSKYMTKTSNFRDEYNAVVAACADLFGATSNECIQTIKSLQAVEMDQQPLGDSQSPVCRGGQEAQPSCLAATNPTATIAPTDTPAGGNSCQNMLQGDADHNGRVQMADYEVWRRAYTSQ